MKPRRPDWDFNYAPSSAGYNAQPPDAASPLDVVVATRTALDETTLSRALRDVTTELSIVTLVERAPLFWTRVRASAFSSEQPITASLEEGGIAVRYVASASVGTMLVPPTLAFSDATVAQAGSWAVHEPRHSASTSTYKGQWFLGSDGGLTVDRAVCGTGAGTRLAVIDDDAADLEHVDLDQLIHVGLDRAPAASGHAGLMVGWATSARRPDGTRFIGLSPDASVRVYLVPKPGTDVVFLPLAIVRAVLDGADVIVCATYVEGVTSPLLDDALDVATHLGRNGRGTLVVLPTGRETSSSGVSAHASLSLELGDPASDPRVHCIAPGGRSGGWFLWRTLRGRLRPFANRGPSVRWLAPGDDLTYPFSSRDRLFHAESSGAAALAAGVLLLAIGQNPELSFEALDALLERSVESPPDQALQAGDLADPADGLPYGRDRDGHNAKYGYGRLNARRACSIARDPFALALSAMGEDELAFRWSTAPSRPYTDSLARWGVTALLARRDLEHGVRALLRHLRLVAGKPLRAEAHATGAVIRQFCLLVRELARMPAPAGVRAELEAVGEELRRLSQTSGNGAAERLIYSAFCALGDPAGNSREYPWAGPRPES